MEICFFGAGCFWGVEESFRNLSGVSDTSVGYQGGHIPESNHVSYEEVCRGNTGHAEVVMVSFDPEQISFEKLLNHFWSIHNPTLLNRQGPDIGTQYRSVIFTTTEDQLAMALASKKSFDEGPHYDQPVVTEIEPAPPYFKAEEYHQQYFAKRGGGTCKI